MVEELNRFPILRRAGAFNVNKKSPQASMEALKYSVNALGDTNNILYIFPQGIIKPPNFRPIELQTGLAYIADKAAKKYGKIAEKLQRRRTDEIISVSGRIRKESVLL